MLKGLIDNIGTGSISAFADYAVAESVSALPATGVATTGYIVGTHIYAYVGTGGDTRDGKYQDLGELNAAGVSLTTNGDGTFTVHVGGNDYTVNLNHTHENMAKLVVCEESDLPSTLDTATIYAITDSGETEIEKLVIRGMEFAGGGGYAPGTPRLTSPSPSQISNGINIGNTTSGVATYSLKIKAKDITQPLVVEWGSGSTGYSFDTTNLPTGVTYDSGTGKLTITEEAACAINGVDIVVVYTGSDTDKDAEGTIGISSSSVDGINVQVSLIANKQTYEELAGVKLNGTQWLQTDYKPGPNTEFTLNVKFEKNSKSNDPNARGRAFFHCPSDGSYRWFMNAGIPSSSTNSVFDFSMFPEDVNNYGGVQMSQYPTEFLHDPLEITYRKGQSNGIFGINGGTLRTANTVLKTTTMAQAVSICYSNYLQVIFDVLDVTIYSLVFSEGGIEKRHYVPKKKNGVPGLYDTVYGSFISSETSDELIAVETT